MGSERKTPERKTEGRQIHYICPKCRKPLKNRLRYRRNECAACGQAIDYESMEKQWWTEWLICRNREEAIRCAEKYNEITRFDFFDPECFTERNTEANRQWPKEMAFFFTASKEYGRFMRWAAKDGITKRISGRSDEP